MKNNLMVIGLCFSAAVNIAFLANIGFGSKQQDYNYIPSENSTRKPIALDGILKLSDSQTVQVQQLRHLLDNDMAPAKEELRQKRFELVSILTEPEPDQEEITYMANQIAFLQSDLQKTIIDNMIEQKKILTPAQQEKYFSAVLARICPERNRYRKRQHEHNDSEGEKVRGRHRRGRSKKDD